MRGRPESQDRGHRVGHDGPVVSPTGELSARPIFRTVRRDLPSDLAISHGPTKGRYKFDPVRTIRRTDTISDPVDSGRNRCHGDDSGPFLRSAWHLLGGP